MLPGADPGPLLLSVLWVLWLKDKLVTVNTAYILRSSIFYTPEDRFLHLLGICKIGKKKQSRKPPFPLSL